MNNEYGLSFPIILEQVLDNNGVPIQVPEVGNPSNLVDLLTPAKPGLFDSIESSIRIILAYQIGLRNFLASFGSILETLIGAPNATSSKNAVSLFVTKAVARWERRLQVANSNVKQEGEYMTIEINGIIKEVQKKFSYKIIT